MPHDGPAEFRPLHGLRKLWQTNAKRGVGTVIGRWRGVDDRVSTEDVEALLGHGSSYHRPSLERLEAVYLSLQPFLTISPSRGRPPAQNHQSDEHDLAILSLRRELRRRNEEVVALNQKVDRLVSMVESLTAIGTVRPIAPAPRNL